MCFMFGYCVFFRGTDKQESQNIVQMGEMMKTERVETRSDEKDEEVPETIAYAAQTNWVTPQHPAGSSLGATPDGMTNPVDLYGLESYSEGPKKRVPEAGAEELHEGGKE